MAVSDEYGSEIGSHTLNFRCEGADLIVESETTIQTTFLFMTTHEQHSRYREVWRDGRLVSYEAETAEDGQSYRTVAKIEGDRMIVGEDTASYEVPLDTVSSHLWNPRVLDRGLLFDMKDGGLLRVQVINEGKDVLRLGGREIKATRYRLGGDVSSELWYDEAHNWLQWRIYDSGQRLTMTRASY